MSDSLSVCTDRTQPFPGCTSSSELSSLPRRCFHLVALTYFFPDPGAFGASGGAGSAGRVSAQAPGLDLAQRGGPTRDPAALGLGLPSWTAGAVDRG